MRGFPYAAVTVPMAGCLLTLEGAHVGPILLVDDDDAVRAVAHRILTRAGYDVVAASDGEEALARLEDQEAVSLVITDTVMPRLAGPALIARLALRFPGVPVLLMSGLTNPDLARGESLPAGVTFLQKPFNVGVLLAATREALDGPRVA